MLTRMWQQMDATSQAIFLNFLNLFEDSILHTKPDKSYFFERQHDDILFASQIPFPLMNGIVSFAYAPQAIETKCQTLLNRFALQDYPITWYWPHSVDIPPDVAAIFTKYGFVSLGNYLSVAMQADTIRHHTATLRANMAIQLVKTQTQFADFLSINQDVYGVPEAALNSMARLYSAYQHSPNIKLYLAYVDNKPCSTLLCYTRQDTLGLYNGATLPAFRKQGLLSNLIINALQEAPHVHYAVAQLMASQNAKGIVEQFGGKACAHFTPLCAGFNLAGMKA